MFKRILKQQMMNRVLYSLIPVIIFAVYLFGVEGFRIRSRGKYRRISHGIPLRDEEKAGQSFHGGIRDRDAHCAQLASHHSSVDFGCGER